MQHCAETTGPRYTVVLGAHGASSHLAQAEESLAALVALEGARDLGLGREREEVEQRQPRHVACWCQAKSINATLAAA